jgi:hypothetical protein
MRPISTKDSPSLDRRKTQIVGLSIVAAIAYGVLHDEITARICFEYFTVAHPPLFGTTSPAILGICWGIVAALGVGLVLGVGLALVSHSEDLPPIPIRHLLQSILTLLSVAAVSAVLAGVVGFELSQRSLVCLPAGLAEVIPISRQDRFMAVWFAHGASYLVGLTGGLFLILRIWWARGKPYVLPLFPSSKGAILRALVLAATVAAIVWYRFAGF